MSGGVLGEDPDDVVEVHPVAVPLRRESRGRDVPVRVEVLLGFPGKRRVVQETVAFRRTHDQSAVGTQHELVAELVDERVVPRADERQVLEAGEVLVDGGILPRQADPSAHLPGSHPATRAVPLSALSKVVRMRTAVRIPLDQALSLDHDDLLLRVGI